MNIFCSRIIVDMVKSTLLQILDERMGAKVKLHVQVHCSTSH